MVVYDSVSLVARVIMVLTASIAGLIVACDSPPFEWCPAPVTISTSPEVYPLRRERGVVAARSSSVYDGARGGGERTPVRW